MAAKKAPKKKDDKKAEKPKPGFAKIEKAIDAKGQSPEAAKAVAAKKPAFLDKTKKKAKKK